MKKTGLLILYNCLVLILTLFSCKKDTTKAQTNASVDIYIGGHYTNDGLTQAAFWKNGLYHPVNLEVANSWAYGIAVNQGHVYLVGEYDNQPCYWKDGQRIDLDAPIFKGFANAIEVKENILYISGSTKQSQDDPYHANLWMVETQAGQISQLPLELIKSNAKDVTVDGDRVYIAGDINDKPCYWTWDISLNSKDRVDLGDGWGSATDITIYNGKVYSLGYYETNELNPYYNCYWENQLIHPNQTSGYYHNDLGFSSNGTLFIVGCDYIPDPVTQSPVIQDALFWQGTGYNMNLLSENSFAESIAFDGSDIYIAGNGPNTAACYWKNGNLVELNTPVSVASDMVLVKK